MNTRHLLFLFWWCIFRECSAAKGIHKVKTTVGGDVPRPWGPAGLARKYRYFGTMVSVGNDST